MKYYLTLLALALALSAPLAQAKTLKFATLLPDGTSYMKLMRKGGKAIEKRTEGRVKIKFYPGGVMGNDASVLRKMRVGQLHGAAFTAGTMTQFHPDAGLYTLPFVFQEQGEVEYVRKHLDGDIRAKLEATGMIPLGVTGAGFGYAMTLKEASNIESLKGLRIWIPAGDPLAEEGVKSIGASAVPLPIADVYTALQTGLLDAVGGTPVGILALQWQSKIKYLLDYPIGYTFGMLVASAKAMKKLSAADQVIVREEMDKVFKQLDAQSWDDNTNAFNALQQLGVKLVPVSAEEAQRWREMGEQTIAATAGEGVYTEAGLARLRQLLAEYRSNKQ